LTSKRDCLSEHEASKRFKNEFLSLLDGIDNENVGVFLLGSTNLPWEIDTAFLRRFERKILIDVPDFEGRIQLIKQYLPCSIGWSESEIADIAESTENYTGDDIRVAVKEANMMEIRKRFQTGIDQKPSEILVEAWQLKESLKSVKPSPIQELLKHRNFNKIFGNS
jgi:katanin p60 ATPase-containing subunit A1